MAIEGQGTKIYMSSSTGVSTSSSAFIGFVTDFTGPGGEAADIDITTFDSTAKDFIIGLRDEGNFGFNVVFSSTDVGQIAFEAARASRSKRKFTLDFSTVSVVASAVGSRRTFDGYAKGWSISGAVDDKITAAANVRITGAVDSTKQTS